MTKAMLLAYVQAHFDCAAKAFRERPSGDAWSNLEQSMYALQRVTYLKETEIESGGIGDWPMGTIISRLAVEQQTK